MNGRLYLDAQMVKAQIGALRHNYPELADDAQLLEDSLAGETGFQEILTQLVRLERDAQSFVAAIKQQEDAMAERRGRYAHKALIYRRMMQSLMESAGQRKVPLPEATVSVVQDRPGCVITDENALADEFVKIERTPKKTEITAALLAGERVAGAELKNRGTHILIRT